MAEFNILSESFITNEEPLTSGTSIGLDAQQVADLISSSGASISVSGGTLSLLLDLGTQKSIDRLDYGFTPVSTSGLTIQYGRDLDNLTAGSLSLIGQSVRVEPTTSGFDYPRYFKVDHVVPSGSPLTLTSLEVINNDTEVNFGEDGNLQSFNLTGGAFSETSTIYELDVRNDGTIPTDMFVSADTSDVDYDLLKKLELSTTTTGTFLSFDSELSIPSAIPWEWGVFENTTVTADNKLAVSNPNNPVAGLGEGDTITLSESNNESTGSIGIEVIDKDGNKVFARTKTNHRIYLMNAVTNTRTISSLPVNSPSNTDEQNYTCLAWDGGDYIYYLNGKDTQELQRYEISTDTHSTFMTGLSFYNRKCKAIFYYEGNLYVMGAMSSAGSSSSVSYQVWRINTTTEVQTRMANMTESPDDALNGFCQLGDDIYFASGPNNGRRFHRYNISSNIWYTLADHASLGTFVNGLTARPDINKVWLNLDGENVYEYDPVTGLWSSNPVLVLSPTNTYDDIIVGFDNTLLFQTEGDDDSYQEALILSEISLEDYNAPVVGTWLSPVMRMEEAENFRRIYMNLIDNDSSVLKFDDSLGVANFQIRGSNETPASDNVVESFGTALDPDVWVQGVFNDTIITSDSDILTFSHQAGVGDYNSGYVTFGFPLGTSSKMQYKFWWNPATDRLSGSTKYSRFYLAPFIDTLETGSLPNRDLETAERSDDDFISLIFGRSSDTGGSFSAIKVYNGSTTSTYNMSASAGNSYEVVWVVDWDTGAYSLHFDGQEIGSGSIPAFKIEELKSQHTFEFFSLSETVDADEGFKYLTVNRVGLEPSSEDDRAIPLHIEDPLYGTAGSLEFFPITVNSPLIPKTDFVQIQLTVKTTSPRPEDNAIVESVEFPPVILLEDVQVGESKPVYLKYNFDSVNNLSTDLLSIKAWMFTDKL